MKYHDPKHIVWLEKEIQVLTNPDSYLHKQPWQLGKKKEKHELSDRLVAAGKAFAASKSEADKLELVKLIGELKQTLM